jgi:hypothetical protein
MTIPADLSGLSKRELQDLAQAATEALLPSCNGDFIKASRLCRAQNPALFAAINRTVSIPEQAPVISNAARQAIVQPEQVIDALGLTGKPTFEECSAAWKAMGNRADASKAPEAFNAIVDRAQREQNLSCDAAKSAVAIRHPVLAQKKDAVLASRKLGATQPQATTGGDATLGNDGVASPALSRDALLNVWQPFLNRARQEAANGSEFAKLLLPALEKLVKRIETTGRDF